jgi:hypothetical protein
MLDSFHEEIRRKRHSYILFWVIVLGFAVLLYMFFQGYYVNVSLGFKKLLHAGSTTLISSASWVVAPPESLLKSFGIINLRVTPEPNSMTINGAAYKNGDKQIFDYGVYSLDVQNPGYLPIQIRIELSRNKSFYLNTINMLRLWAESQNSSNLTSIVKNGSNWIATTQSGGYEIIKTPYWSGSVIPMTTASGVIRWATRHIGEGFFSSGSTLFASTPLGVLTSTELPKWVVLCPDAQMIRWDIFCPKLWTFLTGKYRDLREKIIEANSELIRTSNSIIRLGGTFFNSSTPLTSTVSFSGASHILTYHDRLMIHNSGRLYDLDKGLTEARIVGLDSIEATKKFGDETIVIGKFGSKNRLIMEDGKNDPIIVDLNVDSITGADIQEYSGAYFITLPGVVLVYYKWAIEPVVIVKWEILALVGTTVFYKRNGLTYTITAEGAE